eukprot:m.98536 g.98536  ORF g.98536 m.98536 type:complete len:925 (+) comp9015_c0_seq1:347-3121(+)
MFDFDVSLSLLKNFNNDTLNESLNSNLSCKNFVFASIDSNSNLQVFVFTLGLLQVFVFLFICGKQLQGRYHLKKYGHQRDSVLLVPPYTSFIYLFAFTLLLYGVLNIVYDTRPYISKYRIDESVLWGIGNWYYHFVLDGLTIFLCFEGISRKRSMKAMWISLAFGFLIGILVSLASVVNHWTPNNDLIYGVYIQGVSEGILVVFYCAVFFAPKSWFHRRPAVYSYAFAWFVYHPIHMSLLLLMYFGHDWSFCAYAFITTLVWGVLKPLIFFQTLKNDQLFLVGEKTEDDFFFCSKKKNRLGNSEHMPLLSHSIEDRETESTFYDETFDLTRKTKMIGYFELTQKKVSNDLDEQEKKLSRTLGQGADGKVLHCTYKNKSVAVKILFSMCLTPQKIRDFCEENKLLSGIRHPNIVKMEGVCVYNQNIASVMEMAYGNLQEYLRTLCNSHTTLSERLPIAVDCARGLDYLHSLGIVHCDIKSLNYIVSKEVVSDWNEHDIHIWLALNGFECFISAFKKNGIKMGWDPINQRGLCQLGTYDKLLKVVGGKMTNEGMRLTEEGVCLLKEISELHNYLTSRHRMLIAKLIDVSSSRFIGTSTLSKNVHDYVSGLLLFAKPLSFSLLSERMSSRSETLSTKGTPQWMSPEHHNCDKEKIAYSPSFSSDIYSLAIVLWEIMTGEVPFGNSERLTISNLVLDNKRPKIPKNTIPAYADLVVKSWAQDPNDRPSAKEVLHNLERILRTQDLERTLEREKLWEYQDTPSEEDFAYTRRHGSMHTALNPTTIVSSYAGDQNVVVTQSSPKKSPSGKRIAPVRGKNQAVAYYNDTFQGDISATPQAAMLRDSDISSNCTSIALTKASGTDDAPLDDSVHDHEVETMLTFENTHISVEENSMMTFSPPNIDNSNEEGGEHADAMVHMGEMVTQKEQET